MASVLSRGYRKRSKYFRKWIVGRTGGILADSDVYFTSWWRRNGMPTPRRRRILSRSYADKKRIFPSDNLVRFPKIELRLMFPKSECSLFLSPKYIQFSSYNSIESKYVLLCTLGERINCVAYDRIYHNEDVGISSTWVNIGDLAPICVSSIYNYLCPSIDH